MKFDEHGRPIGLEEVEPRKKEASKPSVEIDEGFSREITAQERAEEVSGRLDSREASLRKGLASVDRDLEDTRTLASFRAANDRKAREGKAGIWARDDEALERQRIETAIQLNDAAFSMGQDVEATGVAKNYLAYVRKSLERSAPEADIFAKTIETIEGEEKELMALEATGRADDAGRKRLAIVRRAKAILKEMNSR